MKKFFLALLGMTLSCLYVNAQNDPTNDDWSTTGTTTSMTNGSAQILNTGLNINPELRIWSDDGFGTSSLSLRDLTANQMRLEKFTAAGASLIDINPYALDGVSAATFRFFRLTNTGGPVFFEIFKGNGTGTVQSRLSANGNSFFHLNSGNVGIGTASPATKLDVAGIITATGGTSTNWNSAYAWGDHALAGYISGGDTANWNSAYTWGDHSLAGYLTSFSETDPKVGTLSSNKIPRWNGTSLENGLISDNDTVVSISSDLSANGLTFGRGAGDILTNVASGYQALFSNTMGSANVASGYRALASNTTGSANVASGYQALTSNTTGFRNAASGNQALASNTTGYANVASGYQALTSNTTGFNNVASGYQALASNTTGNSNVASGYRALFSNTTGNSNVASGYWALSFNTTGNSNVASGYNALFSNTTGNSNVASGYQALFSNTTGSANVASGYQALTSNTTGFRNAASGYWALTSNTTGFNNVASGYWALASNTTGNSNVASGYQALASNTTGNSNVASGYQALFSNTTGNSNVASGYEALRQNVSGSDNIALGYQAGYYELGSDKLYIENSNSTTPLIYGDFASDQLRVNGEFSIRDFVGIGTSAPDAVLHIDAQGGSNPNILLEGSSLDLCVASGEALQIGHWNLSTNTFTHRMEIESSGQVGIGTSSPNGLFEIGLDQGRKPSTNLWTIPSDERLKDVSGDYEKGLDEIMQLEPIKYFYKNVGERTFKDEVLSTENVGFSAQEVQKVFPEAVGTDDDGYLNFNMHSILVAQVNAIKEQQKEIVDLRMQIANLENSNTNNLDLSELLTEFEKLKAELSNIKDEQIAKETQYKNLINQMTQFDIDLQQCCLHHQTGSTHDNGSSNGTGLDDKAHLAQNVPNPFNERTIIKYYIPGERIKDKGESAVIRVMDLKGTVLWRYNLVDSGYGQIEIDANTFAPATYIYELIVGDKKIDSKKMIIE